MEELEKLYKERILIKQLLSIDYARYSHLLARSQEIKLVINSSYCINAEIQFCIYNIELSDKIQKMGIELLKELNVINNNGKI